MGTLRSDRQKIAASTRMQKVIELRVAGLTYPQIAKELGISLQTVHSDLHRYTTELPHEQAEHHRQIQLDQLDYLTRKLTPRIAKNDYRAFDLMLRIIEQKMKLTGTNRPPEEATDKPAREALDALVTAIKDSVD